MPFTTVLGPGVRPNSAVTSRLTSALRDTIALEAGGFKLTGLNLEVVDTASVKLQIPLRAGRFELPADYDDAIIEIQRGTMADVFVEASRGDDGQLLIRVLDMTLSKSLRIKNPSGAFEPVDSGDRVIDDIGTSIKDAAADLLVHGTAMDLEGNVHLHGTVDLPWFMPNEEVDRIVGKIDRNAEIPSFKVDDHAVLTEALRRAGALTDTADYVVRLRTEPTSIGIEGNGADIRAKHEEVDVLVSGTADLRSDGTIHIEVEDNEEPEVVTGGGNLDFSGSLEMEIDAENRFEADGTLEFEARVSNITGHATPSTGLTVPINFVAPDELVAMGSTGVSLRNATMRLRDGRFEAKLDNEVSSNLL